MALPFRSVLDLYEAAPRGVSLAEWSQQMDEMSGTDLYSAGQSDNWIKRASIGLDRLLEKTGLPELGRSFGRPFGEAIGAPELGESIGAGLPRTAVNFLPMLGGPIGRLGVGALSGAQAYTDTGSPASGVVSGLVNMFMPNVANFAEQAVLKGMGGRLVSGPLANASGNVSQFSRFFPKNVGQTIVAEGAGQGLAALFGEAGSAVSAGFDPNNEYNLDPKSILLESTLGQLPFSAIHLGQVAATGRTSQREAGRLEQAIAKTQENINLRQAKEDVASRAGIETIPLASQPRPVTPEVQAEIDATLSRLRGEQRRVLSDPNLTDDQRIEQLRPLVEADAEVSVQRGPAQAENVMGAQATAATGRMPVTGRELRNDKRSRTILVSPAESNPPELRGKVVNYSKGNFETSPEGLADMPGFATFHLPDGWFTVLPDRPADPVRADGQPELTPAVSPRADWSFDLERATGEAMDEFMLATTPAQLQSALLKLRAAQEAAGFPLTDDVKLKTRMDELIKVGLKADRAAQAAGLAEGRRTQRSLAKLASHQQRLQDIRLGDEFRAEQEAAFAEGFDPDIADEVQQLHLLEETVQSNRSTHADALLSGDLNRMYRDWAEAGRKGGFEGFVGQVMNSLKTGKGLTKMKAPEVPKALTVKPEPDNRPITDELIERVSAFMDDPDAQAAFKAWPLRDEGHSFLSEKANFVALMDAHALGDKTAMAEILAEREGLDEIEARDEAENYVRRPHVAVWMEKLQEQAQANARLPISFVPSRWVPEAPEEQKILEQVQPERGGEGLRSFLEKATDPRLRALAKDLKKFGESLSRVRVQLEEINGEGTAQSTMGRSANIKLHPQLFLADPARAETVVAHELLHGLTLAELDNPTNSKIVKELDAFRDRLAQNLPKDLKSRYDNAVKTKWIDRYDGSAEMLQQLGSNWKDQNIVYGLLNNKELISQGFSDPGMREFMTGLKSDGGGWYHRFTNFVKRLLGMDEKSTAYDEFLSRSDALLQQGEWISSFLNYSERFYENEGVPQHLAKSQAQRALRLVMDSANGTSRDIILATLDVPPHVKSSDLARSERGLQSLLTERGDDFVGLSQVMDEQGLSSDKAGVDELVQAVARGEIDPEVFDLLPSAAARYAFAKTTDMQQVMESVIGASQEKNAGAVNLAQPQMLRGPLREAYKALEKVRDAERYNEEMLTELRGLFATSPDGLFDKVVGDPSRAPKWVPDVVEDTVDGANGFGSWLKNFLQPTGQRARENPETAEAYSRGYQLQANARNFAKDTLMPMGLDLDAATGTPTKESIKAFTDAMKNPRLQKAADRWIYLNQQEGRRLGETQMLTQDNAEVKKLLDGLSQKDQETVAGIVSKQVASNQVENGKSLEYMKRVAATRGAAIANVDNGLKTSQNIPLITEMFESILDLNDPMKAPLAQQRLSAVMQRFNDPQTYADLLRFTENEVQHYRAWEELFKKNPAYANAQRTGKYLVYYMKNGKEQLGQAESKAQGRLYVKERGGTAPRFVVNEKSNAFDFGPDAPALIQRIKQLEENRIQILTQKGVPENVIAAVRDAGIGTQLATEAAYRAGIPSADARARRLTKGAEDLPWLENHFHHVFKRANYWSRQLFRAQMDAHLMEKEITDRPDLQKELATHRDNMLQPDPENVRKVTRFMGTWFLGFNAASALVNTIQPFTSHVAELTSMTGKPLDSYRRVLRSLRELAGGKSARTEEHDWLEKQAVADGEIDLRLFDDEDVANEVASTNYVRAINGNKPQTTGQYLSKAANWYSQKAFIMFRMTEQMNNKAALLTAFDYYREQGLSREAARDKAYEYNHAVNFGGGRAQRPVGAFSGKSPVLRGAAMLGTSLQSYVLGTTFQLARYLNKGLLRPAGLTPAETYAARKAAVQMLGTQLLAAGGLGLPFVSGAIALLDKAFPGLELNKNIREMVSSFFGEDEENGNTMTDMAMTGVPSMLGWDLQSRLSMGNTVPGVSEINGFQPELLAGPVASMVTNFVNGGRKVVGGDTAGLSNLTPPGIRKLSELLQDGETVRDYKNRSLFAPTPGESLGLALGFQPKRLSDLNAADRMSRQSEEVANRREGQWRTEQATLLLKGEFGTVRQSLLARSSEDKSYNPVDAARRVVQTAEELQFPRDLRREGSKNRDSQLLSSFGIKASAGSEMARLQFRVLAEQRLGVPARDRSSELRLAQLMDSLPANLTRSERRRQAERLLGRRVVQPTLEEPPV